MIAISAKVKVGLDRYIPPEVLNCKPPRRKLERQVSGNWRDAEVVCVVLSSVFLSSRAKCTAASWESNTDKKCQTHLSKRGTGNAQSKDSTGGN